MPGVEVTGPDGQTYQFPDGTTKDQAVAYFKKKGIGVQQAKPQAQPGFMDSVNQYLQSTEGSVGERVMKGVGRVAVGIPQTIINAAKPPDKSSTAERVTGAIGGPMALAAKRLVVDPWLSETQKAADTKGVESLGHFAAASLPLVGPWAASMGERMGKGDVAGAMSEFATGLLAPKAIEKGLGALPSASDIATKLENKAIELNNKALKPKNMAKPAAEAVARAQIWGTTKSLPAQIRSQINAMSDLTNKAAAAADQAGVTFNVKNQLQGLIDTARERPAFMGDKQALMDINKWSKSLSTPVDPRTGQVMLRDWTKLKPTEALEMSRGLEKSAGWEGKTPPHIQRLASEFRKVLGTELDNATPGLANVRRLSSGLIEAEKGAQIAAERTMKEQTRAIVHWLSAPNLSKFAVNVTLMQLVHETGVPYLYSAGAVMGLRALAESTTSRTFRAAAYMRAADILTGSQLPKARISGPGASGGLRPQLSPGGPPAAPNAPQGPQVPPLQQLTSGQPPQGASPQPAASPQTTVGTASGAATDTALFQQAKAKLGPNATLSQVAQEAQRMKEMHASAPIGVNQVPESQRASTIITKEETTKVAERIAGRSATKATIESGGEAIADAAAKLQERIDSAKSGAQRAAAQKNLDALHKAINEGDLKTQQQIRKKLQAADRFKKYYDTHKAEGEGRSSVAPAEPVAPTVSPEQHAIALQEAYQQLAAIDKIPGTEATGKNMVGLLQRQAKQLRLDPANEYAQVQEVLDFIAKKGGK